MSDSPRQTPRPGSIRSLLGGVFSLLLTRFELFLLEAEEHKDNLLFSLLLGGLALILLLIGLLSALLLVLVLTPAAYRPALLSCLTLASVLGAAGLLWQLRRRAYRSRAPFADTVAEVRKDWDSLSGRR
ncbi:MULTISPECIES: phage holin family protein [Aquitalea]|uniref:Putative membrane protein YqjE n=1 Tax=Aquitalea magnusonii TaxID=332411 RepID=A0A318IUK6_9NEIS|nr:MULTISPECIES: phage holin family protein [Aquitalea]PXX38874.1 putative membrane protein YqjE [Aquitalea magnusonii]